MSSRGLARRSRFHTTFRRSTSETAYLEVLAHCFYLPMQRGTHHHSNRGLVSVGKCEPPLGGKISCMNDKAMLRISIRMVHLR